MKLYLGNWAKAAVIWDLIRAEALFLEFISALLANNAGCWSEASVPQLVVLFTELPLSVPSHMELASLGRPKSGQGAAMWFSHLAWKPIHHLSAVSYQLHRSALFTVRRDCIEAQIPEGEDHGGIIIFKSGHQKIFSRDGGWHLNKSDMSSTWHGAKHSY